MNTNEVETLKAELETLKAQKDRLWRLLEYSQAFIEFEKLNKSIDKVLEETK